MKPEQGLILLQLLGRLFRTNCVNEPNPQLLELNTRVGRRSCTSNYHRWTNVNNEAEELH